MPKILRTIINGIKYWSTHLQTMGTLLVTFLMLFLVLLAGIVVLNTYRQVARQLAEDQHRGAAIASAERLSERLESYLRVLDTLANQSEMKSGEPTLQQNTLERGTDLIRDFTNWDAGVLVLDAQGFVSVAYPLRPDLVGHDLSQQSYFQAVKQSRSPSFSNVIQEPTTGKEMVVVAMPIINAEDAFIGVIAGRLYIEFQALGAQIQPSSLSNKAWAYAVDRNGVVLYHPYNPLIGTDFKDQSAVQRLQQGESTGALTDLPFVSEQAVQGFAIVPITGWGVVVGTPWLDIIAPARDILIPSGQVLIVGMFVFSLVVALGVRQVSAPLGRLVTQAQKVTEGDYDATVPLSRIGEIRELGEAFNEMVSQIRRYRGGMRQYIAGVTRSQEEERKRIARDLHDDTVQSLIAIGQRVDLAKSMLDEPEEARQRLSDLRRMVNDTVASVRQFSRDLRPLALEDLGLVAAMEYLTAELARSQQIIVDLEIIGEPEGLPADMEVAIYRMLQEALNNVRKHAKATEVNVTVQFTRIEVQLTVEDNGRGFEVPEAVTDFAHKGSLGVIGLQERAQLFGGRLEIESLPGQGTQVKVIVPRQISLSPFDTHYAPYLQGVR